MSTSDYSDEEYSDGETLTSEEEYVSYESGDGSGDSGDSGESDSEYLPSEEEEEECNKREYICEEVWKDCGDVDDGMNIMNGISIRWEVGSLVGDVNLNSLGIFKCKKCERIFNDYICYEKGWDYDYETRMGIPLYDVRGMIICDRCVRDKKYIHWPSTYFVNKICRDIVCKKKVDIRCSICKRYAKGYRMYVGDNGKLECVCCKRKENEEEINRTLYENVCKTIDGTRSDSIESVTSFLRVIVKNALRGKRNEVKIINILCDRIEMLDRRYNNNNM